MCSPGSLLLLKEVTLSADELSYRRAAAAAAAIGAETLPPSGALNGLTAPLAALDASTEVEGNVGESVPSPTSGAIVPSSGLRRQGKAFLPSLAATKVVSKAGRLPNSQLAAQESMLSRLARVKAIPLFGSGYDVQAQHFIGLINSFIVHQMDMDPDLAVAGAVAHLICSVMAKDTAIWTWQGFDALLIALLAAGVRHGAWPTETVGELEAMRLLRLLVSNNNLRIVKQAKSELTPEVRCFREEGMQCKSILRSGYIV